MGASTAASGTVHLPRVSVKLPPTTVPSSCKDFVAYGGLHAGRSEAPFGVGPAMAGLDKQAQQSAPNATGKTCFAITSCSSMLTTVHASGCRSHKMSSGYLSATGGPAPRTSRSLCLAYSHRLDCTLGTCPSIRIDCEQTDNVHRQASGSWRMQRRAMRAAIGESSGGDRPQLSLRAPLSKFVLLPAARLETLSGSTLSSAAKIAPYNSVLRHALK